MNNNKVNSAFFIGIGGIGMSALALFFKSVGISVFGYDKVASNITEKLLSNNISIIFNDDPQEIDSLFLEENIDDVLVVYTAAIPEDQSLLNYFKNKGYHIQKRAIALAEILKGYKTLAIAGTHGKTTTCAILTQILDHSGFGCNAFIGGIANNFNSNLVLNDHSEYAVVEADEYDRSFLSLSPITTVVTSTDPDHLDIYQSEEEFSKSFDEFVNKTVSDGIVILHESVKLIPTVNYKFYGLKSENRIENYSISNSQVTFDMIIGNRPINNISFCLPGIYNACNALAAAMTADFLGVEDYKIKKALQAFTGVKRRFEYHINTQELIYIDDYAHHPGELKACINSVKSLYPDKNILGVFQPHLYSRTKDFMQEFAEILSQLDQVVLLDIYPARELPIPGVTSETLLDLIDLQEKILIKSESLVETLQKKSFDVLLTLGAGDIDQSINSIKTGMIENLNLQAQKR